MALIYLRNQFLPNCDKFMVNFGHNFSIVYSKPINPHKKLYHNTGFDLPHGNQTKLAIRQTHSYSGGKMENVIAHFEVDRETPKPQFSHDNFYCFSIM